MEKAIREAVEETVKQLGIETIKKLSWFPHNGRVAQ